LADIQPKIGSKRWHQIEGLSSAPKHSGLRLVDDWIQFGQDGGSAIHMQEAP